MTPKFDNMLNALLEERDRWPLWLPLPVALGVAFYFSLPLEPPLLAGPVALLMLIAIWAPFHANRLFVMCWGMVLLVVLGFTAGQIRTWNVTAPVLEKKAYGVTVQGRVVEANALERGWRVVLEDIHLRDGEARQKTLPKRIRVKLKNTDPLKPRAGDIIAVRGVLMPLSPPVLPGAFDFQRHAFFKRLGATGYALGDAEIIEQGESGFLFENMRRYIREHIEADVKDKEHAALITAFMVGDDDGIPEKTWEVTRLSGIAHLIAISGSHFLLIGGFAFFLVRALLAAIPYIALRWPIKKIAAAAAIAVAVFYMLLIGAPVPAQRAVLSVCVIMGAIILDRDPFTLRIVAFSALVILLFEPESLAGASFQLSFAAVAGLVAVYESSRDWWSAQLVDAPWYRRYALYLLGCFISTLVAGLATAPFSLYHFSSMSLTGGMIANIIAVPISSFITFPAGLIACVLMPLGLEQWPLWVTEQSLGLIMNVAETVAAWPHASQHADAWPAALLGLFGVGGMWLAIWQGKKRYLGFLPIAFAAVLIPFTPRADILVSSGVDLFAVRAPDRVLWISSKSKQKFIRTEWTEREGGHGIDFWREGEGRVVSCAGETCEAAVKGQRILIITGKAGLPENCAPYALVLSTEPFKEEADACRSQTRLMDRWDLWRNGAHAIYVSQTGGVKVVSSRDFRGRRPWTGRQ
ncbi:MAG TPA: ComEC/Rec2 family competence protein [Patescibacteria group bacterium]|nr:ComEC/Rec2 family competence protein [Patescibacteria group bacterium]